MIEKYKIPDLKTNELRDFDLEEVLKDLAMNKHNDNTVTYHLLMKQHVTKQQLETPRERELRLASIHE